MKSETKDASRITYRLPRLGNLCMVARQAAPSRNHKLYHLLWSRRGLPIQIFQGQHFWIHRVTWQAQSRYSDDGEVSKWNWWLSAQDWRVLCGRLACGCQHCDAKVGYRRQQLPSRATRRLQELKGQRLWHSGDDSWLVRVRSRDVVLCLDLEVMGGEGELLD